MCREKLFRDVLDIIIAFLDSKNINTNRWKNLHFSKGGEKLCNDLLDRVIAFLDNKNNNIKRSQNLHFSKGVRP